MRALEADEITTIGLVLDVTNDAAKLLATVKNADFLAWIETGVVGEQPVLSPGESFRYTSGAVLPTARGTMKGTYQMHRADGAMFDAEIAEFLLERPYSLN